MTPEPGQFWATAQGRTVEIVAAGEVACDESCGFEGIEVLAYRFLGGSVVHLRSARALTGWVRVHFG
jgi:hypothetical protein